MARSRTISPVGWVAVAVGGALGLASCSAQPLPESSGAAGTVVVDGASSTIPLAEAARDEFVADVEPGVIVEVNTASTARGLEKLCTGESDVVLATRPMTEEESARCEAAGVPLAEVPIAVDAVSVLVSAENDFVRCLTGEEVARLWAPESEASLTSWSQLRDDFPDLPVMLFGPAEGSGTLDQVSAATGEAAISRADYAASDDDNVIIDGVRDNPSSLGVVGLSPAAQADGVRRVSIDSGEGCVAPGASAAADGSYALSRTLLAYASQERYEADPAVSSFVDYLVDRSAVLARRAGAVPLGEGQESVARDALTSLGGTG